MSKGLIVLEIKDLSVSVAGKAILNGVNLCIPSGQIHALMGPNGSGKSTLTHVIAGDPDYQVDSGDILFEVHGKPMSLLSLSTDQRARLGVFLSFQYPPEISGVMNREFLKASFHAICKDQGIALMDDDSFEDYLQGIMKSLDMESDFLNRELNVDFSGGEKKRNEILQLAVLSPRLAMLDEVDSGLDIDGLKVVADKLKSLHDESRSFLLVTHYNRFLHHMAPHKVHVIMDGRIVCSGGADLAEKIESQGYEGICDEALSVDT